MPSQAARPGSPVEILKPADWPAAAAMKARWPHAIALAGGLDIGRGVSIGASRPSLMIDLTSIAGFSDLRIATKLATLNAGVTYSDLIELRDTDYRVLSQAAAVVASVQVRNRGTIGGAVASANPSSDIIPALLSLNAEAELISATGERRVPLRDFLAGPHMPALSETELIRAIRVRPCSGPQPFMRVGLRRGMIVGSSSFALAIDTKDRYIGIGLGGVAPAPTRATAAETFLSEYLDRLRWQQHSPVPPVLDHFAHLVRLAADPVDDIYGSAEFKVHVLGVIAGRALHEACQGLGP